MSPTSGEIDSSSPQSIPPNSAHTEPVRGAVVATPKLHSGMDNKHKGVSEFVEACFQMTVDEMAASRLGSCIRLGASALAVPTGAINRLNSRSVANKIGNLCCMVPPQYVSSQDEAPREMLLCVTG